MPMAAEIGACLSGVTIVLGRVAQVTPRGHARYSGRCMRNTASAGARMLPNADDVGARTGEHVGISCYA